MGPLTEPPIGPVAVDAVLKGPSYNLASFLKASSPVQAAFGSGSVNKKPEWLYSSM